MDTCGTIFPAPFFSGDDIPITIQFFQSDGVTAKPMTGYMVSLMVKTIPLNDQFEAPFPDSTAVYFATINGDNTGVFPFLIPGLLVGTATDVGRGRLEAVPGTPALAGRAGPSCVV